MSEDCPEVRPEDALDVAQRALAKISALEDDIEQLQSDRDDLRDRVVSLELRISEFDDDRDYSDLSRDDKIGMVREELFEHATGGRGRAFDYTDVRDVVFDGEPSPGHCYDLIRWASRPEGFAKRDPANGEIQLVIDPDVVRRTRAFYSANKAGSEGVR